MNTLHTSDQRTTKQQVNIFNNTTIILHVLKYEGETTRKIKETRCIPLILLQKVLIIDIN